MTLPSLTPPTYLDVVAAAERLSGIAHRTPVKRSAHMDERLGAKLDGVLRSHQINQHPDAAGSLRDTCVYSILASEWPTVRAHLDHQLRKPRP